MYTSAQHTWLYQRFSYSYSPPPPSALNVWNLTCRLSILCISDMMLPFCACPPAPLWTHMCSWPAYHPLDRFCPTTTPVTSPAGASHRVSLAFKYTNQPWCCLKFISDSFLFLSSDLHAAGGSLSAQLKQAYLPVVDYNNALVVTGGEAPWRTPWFALVVEATLDVM